MAILSDSEFEAVIQNAMMRIDKELVVRGDIPPLKVARRGLENVLAVSRDKAALKGLFKQLSATCEEIRANISDDQKLSDSLWDLVDYVDYRC